MRRSESPTCTVKPFRTLLAIAAGALLMGAAWAQSAYFSGPSVAKISATATFSGKGFAPNASVMVMVKAPGGTESGYSAMTGADGAFQLPAGTEPARPLQHYGGRQWRPFAGHGRPGGPALSLAPAAAHPLSMPEVSMKHLRTAAVLLVTWPLLLAAADNVPSAARDELLFMSNRSDSVFELYRMAADGTRVQRLLPERGEAEK